MNTILWIAQIVLAVVFLFTGIRKLFAYEKATGAAKASFQGAPADISRGLAVFIGLAEIAGALGVVAPVHLVPEHLLVLISAGALALIMVLAGIYRLRREEEAAPVVAIFLLALFVIVGRWPR
jgi:uncharacterized membrane protein YphA (DoxX/SURF4 family)